MGYTTQNKVEGYLTYNLDSVQAAHFSSWLTAIENWIENFCGTDFEGSGVSSDKYYDGTGGKELIVDEFYGTPTVVFLDEDGNEDDTLASTDLWSYPLNETVKNKIVLSAGGDYYSFPKGVRRVKVSATFGHSSVPKPVELAATMLVAMIVKDGIQGGRVASEDLQEYAVAYEKIDHWADVLGIREILQPYRQMSL